MQNLSSPHLKRGLVGQARLDLSPSSILALSVVSKVGGIFWLFFISNFSGNQRQLLLEANDFIPNSALQATPSRDTIRASKKRGGTL